MVNIFDTFPNITNDDGLRGETLSNGNISQKNLCLFFFAWTVEIFYGCNTFIWGCILKKIEYLFWCLIFCCNTLRASDFALLGNLQIEYKQVQWTQEKSEFSEMKIKEKWKKCKHAKKMKIPKSQKQTWETRSPKRKCKKGVEKWGEWEIKKIRNCKILVYCLLKQMRIESHLESELFVI